MKQLILILSLVFSINFFAQDVNKTVSLVVSGEEKTQENSLNNLTSASAVYNKYIAAIGGVKTIENINTVKMVFEYVLSDFKIKTTEFKIPNKYKFILDFSHSVIFKIVINGNNSYLLNNGKKKEIDEKEIQKYFDQTDPQYQIHQEIFGINRVFKQRIDNNDILSYSIDKNNEVEEYYDVNTGYLVKKIQTVIGSTSKNVEITEFEDYKEISGFTGYKVPYIKRVKTNNEDVVVHKLVLIEINKDISDNEFE